MDLSEESEQEDLVELDPDWVKTPMGRRPQRRSGRRTQSAGASSLIINSGQGQVTRRVECIVFSSFFKELTGTVKKKRGISSLISSLLLTGVISSS